jgi:putative transposase
VVFIPKFRKKAIYGKIRANLGPIFHELARQKECKIIEGKLVVDHVHVCIEIPPKHAVSSIIGFLKGKSAIAIARMSGKDRNFNGENFWARGYAVSTSATTSRLSENTSGTKKTKTAAGLVSPSN